VNAPALGQRLDCEHGRRLRHRRPP
jgi:hypothetical protein